MNFTVQWDPDSEGELHFVWLAAAEPAAVRESWERAKVLLSVNPEQLGSHIAEGLWKLVISPIAVYFTIDHHNRIV